MAALPHSSPARLLPFSCGIATGVAAGRATGIAAVAVDVAALFVAAFVVAACARPPDPIITAEAFDRDRLARADLVAAIAADHETLAALIATDRFETPGAIYRDPELRAIAKRLVDETRALDGLASTDVLAPGAP